ncbi:hypothetical protein E6P09_00155 [Haloferax mediterranei ATCC 33500]|uniref:Uncharacterized protein n=1 Tax=Haloferax mediterranei (strain ATCC 33500 / DSM 1411 / JCM 8866 / NBRC 14739 / NCIMB 2177 / R-4) TaxID=523841 RepID=I3R6Y1_HALMT|nr:hypothetical protein [Haloferax mediterranei]AFK19991.1 hypothetical protein HFX_2304 [Haloferax mediterranei ATCC 33500]AHZ23370.1 hypothetical protein BM92_12300 [Haloferax mediterranei ATCC 33500]ELZ99538.1 hypothetical protein C439_13329 [Haloferax mediterranei ATCC 33500]MDX5987256.1 hypothetical protein [Haloferax mediterranei ATCC 33500]QCQ73778.1 hypothetical protein E6P09_00155 [Haloferax mediterranei ATCC 33500]
MKEPSLGSIIGDRSDVELAAIFERIWEARGYEARVRFHGPDVNVEAEGETPEGAHREIRIWVTSTRAITADMTSAFVRTCNRADIEPYVAAVGHGRLEADAYQPGLVVLDAPSIAVEVRETGVESFVHQLVDEDDESTATNWLGDPVDADGEADETATDETDDEEDGEDDDDKISRREAVKKAGTYVTGGLVTYLIVEKISDIVQRSPKLRAAISRRAAWVESHLPEINTPTVEWSVPTPQPLYDDPRQPNRTTTSSKPANATAIPYETLREDPAAYTGTAVTYTGRVEETMERGEIRFATIAVEDSKGRLRGDVVARWPVGQFFDDDIGFRLLDTERVRIWGVVSGAGSLSGSRQYPQIDVSVLEKA